MMINKDVCITHICIGKICLMKVISNNFVQGYVHLDSLIYGSYLRFTVYRRPEDTW